MLEKLTSKEEQCIDDILTKGLNEINDVPSLALSSMGNLSTLISQLIEICIKIIVIILQVKIT